MAKLLPGKALCTEFVIVSGVVLTLCSCGGGSSTSSSSSNSTGSSSAMTYSLSGTISGLGAASGLVILNNGEDATTIAANSTEFTMKTPVALGSVYDISVGSQPYGLTLACSVSGGGGTVAGNVTSIAVSCGNATPTKKAIAGYFANPRGVAVDTSGNVFVVDNGDNSIREIPYSGGNYGAALTVGSGFSFPYAIAMDANGNVFVADAGHASIKEIPNNGGSYGALITVASGFLTPDRIAEGEFCPTGVAVSPSGSVFAVCNSDLLEIPFSGGSYGATITVASGFGFARDVALDAKGNAFVADATANAVYEVPFNGSGYGTPIPLGSGFNYPEGVALDAVGDVFVSDTENEALKEIPFSNGSYGAPIIVAAALGYNLTGSTPGIAGLAVDTTGNVFVADATNNAVWKVPLNGGAYGTPLAVGSGISTPVGFAVDANDNLFVADVTSMSIREIPYSGGTYHSSITVGPGLGDPISVTVTPSGNVIAAESTYVGLIAIPLSGGAYSAPGRLLDRNKNPIDLYGGAPCLASDANGDLFLDLNTGMNNPPVKELLFSAGYYQSSAQTIGTVPDAGGCSGIAVDSNQNVFVTSNGVVYEYPFKGIGYGAAITLNAGSGDFGGMAVDANDDVFVADSMNNVVTEIPFTNGSYSTPIIVGSGFNGPFSLAMGHKGQLFVADRENIWQIGP